MNVREKTWAYNGVVKWLNSHSDIDIGKPKKKTYRAVSYPRLKHVGLNESSSPETSHLRLKAVD